MLPLKNYQESVIEYAIKNPYSILAPDPGLGKTRIAIETNERVGARCLVICPSYLITNWIDEIKMWSKDDKIITAITKGNQIYDLVDSDYAIISYDLAQKAEYFFEWCDILILDEAHLLKSMKAKRTQFIHKQIFENSISRVHLLTATPIKNRVAEYYSLLAICNYDPRIADSKFLTRFPSEIDFADYFSFREEYSMEVGNRYVTIVKWSGLRRTPELKEYLKGHYITIKSDDVLDLPPLTFKDVLVSDAPDLELLKAFNSYFNNEGMDGVNPTAKSQAALKKAPFTIKYVENLLEEVDSVLVYTDHILASEEIARAFSVKPLNGNMQSTKRMELAKRFQNGEGRVLVATIPSLSAGVNLTRSNHIILNDYPWIPGDVKQTIYRIQRMTQTKPCFVHRIIGSPQDKKIMDTLYEKNKVIQAVT